MGPQKFTKRPVTIEAMRVPDLHDVDSDESIAEYLDECIAVAEWCGGLSRMMDDPPPEGFGVYIDTLEGPMRAAPGDWIIRGVAGEFYPVKPDIFAETYTPADDEDDDDSTDDLLLDWYPVLRYFAYDHLPEHLQGPSKRFHDVAWAVARSVNRSPEAAVALRKLLEAKDAAVRAALPPG